ncbi:T9SS type A sorting domain-containing protein [bacterium]|nr:T9SS type A sorting domain-containing protein [bacterium]
MKYVLGVFLVLVLAAASYAVDTAPYYPMAVGNNWTYRDSTETGYENYVQTIEGTTMMDGYETYVYVSDHGEESDTSYYQNRSDGIYNYFLPPVAEFGLEFDMIEVKYLPHEMNVGDEWQAFEIDTALEFMGILINVNMLVTSVFEGYEDVTTPYGIFENCIVVTTTNDWKIDAGMMFADSGVDIQTISKMAYSVGEVYFHENDVFGGLMGGTPSNSSAALVDYELSGINEYSIFLPGDFEVSSYPNPFNAACRISVPAGADIRIFDLTGKLVGTPFSNSGISDQFIIWQPSEELNSGTYLVKATRGSDTSSHKLIYLK